MEKDVFTHPKTGLTPEDYLELERRAEIRSEYLDGEMYAMPGVKREHSRIVINTITELNTHVVPIDGIVCPGQKIRALPDNPFAPRVRAYFAGRVPGRTFFPAD